MSTETKKLKRNIIIIDENKCDGCGVCVPSCHEGAIQIVDGKAKLVKEIYCDGLGACLNECPLDAITIEEREADAFDETASLEHVEKLKEDSPELSTQALTGGGGCQGTVTRDRGADEEKGTSHGSKTSNIDSQLRQWPVQIHLVPPSAPYLQGADLLIAADCVPFAYKDFHNGLLKGRRVLIGCPKLDDIEKYQEKFKEIIEVAKPKSISVAIMEVPCCAGLLQATREAVKDSGSDLEVKAVIVGVEGDIRE